MGDADAEALLARAVAGVDPSFARKHGHVRREHALRATRHHERDSALDRARRERQMRRERVAQGGDREFPGEIVHPAVALGLPQHRENGLRLERAAVDERHQAGHVSGPSSRNANDFDRIRLHGPSASSPDQEY
jgi:hypothetical protein